MPGRYQAETQAAVVDIGCLGEMIDDDGPGEPAAETLDRDKFLHAPKARG